MHAGMLSVFAWLCSCQIGHVGGSRGKLDGFDQAILQHEELDGKLQAHISLSDFPPGVFSVMKHRGESIIDGKQRSNACEGLDRKYNIPPLERSPTDEQLKSWCGNTWPEFSKNVSTQSTIQTTCNWNHWVTEELAASLQTEEPIMIPVGDELVEYKFKRALNGGMNNMGLLVLEKSALDLPGTVVVNASGHRAVQVSGAQRAHSLPVTLVLKIGTRKDYDSEAACMKATAEINGLPRLYSDAFKFKGHCYKALVMDFNPGKLWGEESPLDEHSECRLQETAGRLMCGVASRGFAEMDWNNPGNWMVAENGEFSRIDMGLCHKHSSLRSGKYIKYRTYQSIWGDTPDSKLGMMWHMHITERWNDGASNLGVGDLVLNSQKRVDLIKEVKAGHASVFFPGSYVSQLGGEDWQPTDPKCKAVRGDDLTTFTLSVKIKPGDYEFKAVMNPEKSGWDDSYGADGFGGGNIALHIGSGDGPATLVFDAIKRTVKVERG